MRYLYPILLLLFSACRPYGYVEQAPAPRTLSDRVPPLTSGQVSEMLEAGISAEVINEKIAERGVLKLSADQLVALKKSGASDELLAVMIESEKKPAPVYTDRRSAPVYSYSYRSYRYGYGYGYPYSHGHYHHGGSYRYSSGRSGSGRSGSRFGW